jgi:hypothetical protein
MATVSPDYQLSNEQWQQVEDLLLDIGQLGENSGTALPFMRP